MPYLKLLSGDADDGPIFGPVRFVEVHLHQGIRLGAPAEQVLPILDGCVCYDGRAYNEWTVFDWPLTGDESGRLVEFDPARAGVSPRADSCECEHPGYFNSGIPGILAHVEDERVSADFDVERCDQCRRYPSDAVARQVLRDCGILNESESTQTYSVQGYVTLRIRLSGVRAASHVGAARHARQLFDGNCCHCDLEFVDEYTDFLVEADGDAPCPQRFNAALDEIPV